MDPLIDLSSMSKPALLALAITVVCRALKAVPFAPDWLIPWAALLMGGVFYPALTGVVDVSSVFTGMIIGGVTVGLYSTAKQTVLGRGTDTKVAENPVVKAIFGAPKQECSRLECSRRVVDQPRAE